MKTRNFVLTCLVVVASSPIALYAQENNKKAERKRPTREQIQQMQCNQIVKALLLDDATAAKFTPVFNNYMNEMREVRDMNRPAPEAKADEAKPEEKAPEMKPMPTDEEVDQAIKERFAQSRKMLDIREKYYNEFREFLSPKQIQKMYDLEKNDGDRFRKEMSRRQGAKKPAGRDKPMPPAPAPQAE